MQTMVPPGHPAFTGLPVSMVTLAAARDRMAVHVSGALTGSVPPLICVPGYHRNMADYADFLHYFHLLTGGNWPVVLVDLQGRGRSSWRHGTSEYGTPADARDLSELARALAIESAVFLGQGYGGQTIMALAALRPALIAATILIDAGPVSDSRGLVRLRNNLNDLQGIRSEAGLRSMFRRMLAPDYPGLTEQALDALARRAHFIDQRGRAQSLFDPRLLKMLKAFAHDDVLVAQWPLYDALGHAPLMVMRSQLTQQLRRETFDEMLRRRRDADGYVIEGQGSPPLLDDVDDVSPIADFVKKLGRAKRSAA